MILSIPKTRQPCTPIVTPTPSPTVPFSPTLLRVWHRTIQSPFLTVVHVFEDLTGRKRNVRKVNKEFMIEGSTKAKYSPTIEDAVRAENDRIIYSRQASRNFSKKVDPPQDRENSLTGSKAYVYSIADFLENVKGVFDNTFSKDVYEKLGMSRKDDDFSKPLHFSLAPSSDKVVISKGEREKQRAQYQSNRGAIMCHFNSVRCAY